MTIELAEALILAANALGTGLLLFVALVVQKVMNDMKPLEFKQFLTNLDRKAERSVYAVGVSVLPLLAAIPYFIAFGFDHWWFTAGVAVWFMASVMSKLLNLPIYRWLEAPENTNEADIKVKRQKLQTANKIRAFLGLASVVLMALQFSL